MKSINPFNGMILQDYPDHNASDLHKIINENHDSYQDWKNSPFSLRKTLMLGLASLLRQRKEALGRLMTLEMGKLYRESLAEIEKCAWVCDYYAEHAEFFLEDEEIVSDASRSFVTFQPLGVVLAVMPWNFPFWQVFRFAAPALMAGNSALLKHASNVPGCAMAIEKLFLEAGFPENLFRTLMIPSSLVDQVIAHQHVKAVTLTGSEAAGSSVAAQAGRLIKKSLLELGGADPFIVLEDADLEIAVKTAVTARMINQGQSCIAAKRFIVQKSILPLFIEKLKTTFESLVYGDPMDPATQVGPLARPDLVLDLDRQVQDAVAAGAVIMTGGRLVPETYCMYQPTILTGVKPGMKIYREETFGPVATIIEAQDDAEAISIANDTEFGLGGCVWTSDLSRGERVARAVETGAMFVNGMTKSDPRLPFGGIKKSGYGRELGTYGIKEFVNIKTIWIA
jgi:succinate-semialdehyde dehydrogenase/glutarate-semialdehyde dehydrogenase